MSSWRSRILDELALGVAPVTLVADPDGLLLEEGVLTHIYEQGFEIVPFEDPIAFRYAYESGMRGRRDRGERVDAVVVLRSPQAHFEVLPSDILQTGRRLSFSIGDLFSNLSRSVLATLEPRDLDALYDAEQRHRSDLRGDNATKEFVLRHVFGIVSELIVTPSDLLTVLLRRHCTARRIPPLLDEHFIEMVRRTGKFPDWPLDVIVPDRDALLAFLQERWPVYLDRSARSALGVSENHEHYALTWPGPSDLPFEHEDVRAYVDGLFLERQLRPVPHGKAALLSGTWAAVGLRMDETADELHRLNRLIEAANEALPDHDDRHDRWFHFAAIWAELVALMLALNSEVPDDERRKVETLRSRVDATFAEWIEKRYPGLVNLPPVPPVMLHHLPAFSRGKCTTLRGARSRCWWSTAWLSTSGSSSAGSSRSNAPTTNSMKARSSPGCRLSRRFPARRYSPEERPCTSRRAFIPPTGSLRCGGGSGRTRAWHTPRSCTPGASAAGYRTTWRSRSPVPRSAWPAW